MEGQGTRTGRGIQYREFGEREKDRVFDCFREQKNGDESSHHPPSMMSLNQDMLVRYFAFWVAVIRSSKPLTMADSAQPGFKRDPNTWKVCAPNAVSLGM